VTVNWKYTDDNTLLEIGYILKKEFWGKGYGSLICQELLVLAEKTETRHEYYWKC
jgi:ribosomal-protein-alanine N-acetyltransferase